MSGLADLVRHFCTVKKKTVKFTVKNGSCGSTVQNTVTTFYCFNLHLQLNTVISYTDIMLLYQAIEVLKSVLHLCNTLITTKSRR